MGKPGCVRGEGLCILFVAGGMRLRSMRACMLLWGTHRGTDMGTGQGVAGICMTVNPSLCVHGVLHDTVVIPWMLSAQTAMGLAKAVYNWSVQIKVQGTIYRLALKNAAESVIASHFSAVQTSFAVFSYSSASFVRQGIPPAHHVQQPSTGLPAILGFGDQPELTLLLLIVTPPFLQASAKPQILMR